MTSWNLKKDSYSISIDNQQTLQQILRVNARLNVSIFCGRNYTLYKSVQGFSKKIQMDMVVMLKKCYYFNFWIIHVQSLVNILKSMWKLVFNVTTIIFYLKVLKGKPTKSRWIMTYVKLSKKLFWNKKIEKQTKIATHMDIWKYGQILTIQKSLTIKQLKFSNKRFFTWIYHFLLHHILSPNNKFGMWINIIFSILWWFSQMTNPYFSISKVHYF